MSNVYEVVARHSPCPLKRLTVEAASRDEAVEKFVEANKVEAQTPRRTKSEPKLVTHVEAWAAAGGTAEVETRLVSGTEPVAEVAKKPAPKKGGLRKLEPATEADPTREME